MSKTNPFAGLLAGFRGASAEESKPEDEEARKARRAEEDTKRNEEDARRAEEDQRRTDEDARRAEEDGTDADDKDGKDGKGNRAEDDDQDPEADAGDDDSDEGMDEKEAKAFHRGVALGRKRENTRSSRIFLSPGAIGRPDLAATLAFTTRNTSAEADRLMGTDGNTPRTRGRLDERMNARTEPRPGGGGGQAATPSFGARVAAAVAKVRPA